MAMTIWAAPPCKAASGPEIEAIAPVTDSTLPSMVLHAGGNVLGAFDLFTRGRSEWQVSAHPRPTIWQTGIDAAFGGSVAGVLVVGALTVWAYRALADVVRTSGTALPADEASLEP